MRKKSRVTGSPVLQRRLLTTSVVRRDAIAVSWYLLKYLLMSLIVVIAETADNLSGQTRMHNLRKKRTNLLHSPPIHSTDYNCNIRRMQLQTENNLLHSLPLNRLHRSPTTRMVLSVRPTPYLVWRVLLVCPSHLLCVWRILRARLSDGW